jgi:hypothetical protein
MEVTMPAIKENFKDRLIRAFPVWRDILKRTTPFVRQTSIAGGSAGAHTVTDIKVQDQLISVLEVATSTAAVTDLTSEFSISADATIDNTGGTDTSSDSLIVTWLAWDYS